MENKQTDIYSACNEPPRQKFVNVVSDEVAESISEGYDLLPLYENAMFQHAFKEHYSLDTNCNLKCRWHHYKRNIENKIFTPFQLPDIKELHFHNGSIKYLPEASIRHMDHRLTQKPGPGVDYLGQMPIPQELLMKRGIKKDTVNVKSDKAGKGKGKDAKKKPRKDSK